MGPLWTSIPAATLQSRQDAEAIVSTAIFKLPYTHSHIPAKGSFTNYVDKTRWVGNLGNVNGKVVILLKKRVK